MDRFYWPAAFLHCNITFALYSEITKMCEGIPQMFSQKEAIGDYQCLWQVAFILMSN